MKKYTVFFILVGIIFLILSGVAIEAPGLAMLFSKLKVFSWVLAGLSAIVWLAKKLLN